MRALKVIGTGALVQIIVVGLLSYFLSGQSRHEAWNLLLPGISVVVLILTLVFLNRFMYRRPEE